MTLDTEIVDIYLAGTRIGTINAQITTCPERGPVVVVGGVWVAYRPKMRAGGITARADIGPMLAQAAGLV